jgi:hypothetical protein
MIATTRSKNNNKNSLLLNCNFFRCNTLQNNTKFCSKVSSHESAKEIAAISHSKTKQKFCNLQKKIAATHSKQQKNKILQQIPLLLNCKKMQQTQNNKKNLQQIPLLLNCKNCNKFKNNTKFYNKIFSNNSTKNSSSSKLQRLQQTQKTHTHTHKILQKKFKIVNNSATNFALNKLHLCLYIRTPV